MAVYQFEIILIPSECLKKNSPNLLDRKASTETLTENIRWNSGLTNSMRNLLSNILPVGKSWHSDLHTWGDDEHADIQIWLDKDIIEDFAIRLDMRDDVENIKNLADKVIDLAKFLDCQLFLPSEEKLIKPDIKLLNEAIAQSRPMRFVTDPRKFLDELDDIEE